jgi:hypothetical protein
MIPRGDVVPGDARAFRSQRPDCADPADDYNRALVEVRHRRLAQGMKRDAEHRPSGRIAAEA